MDRSIDLKRRLATIEPFAGLPDDVLAMVAAASRVVRIGADEHLVETGQPAASLFVALSGRFAALAQPGDPVDAALAELGPGSVIGEIAVLAGGTRSATLRALEPAEVAEIDGPRFVALLEEQPALGAALARLASARLLATRLQRHLAELFPDPETADLASIVDDAEVVHLEPGAVLFSEGDPADAAYLVIAGRVRVLQRDRDGNLAQPVAEVGPGELIGERALLADVPRNATVVAARPTHLARMPRGGFEQLMLAEPRAMLAVTRRLVARQQDTRHTFARARSGRASVVLVPVAPETDVVGLSAALASELERQPGSVRVLTATDVDRGVGLDGAAQTDRGAPAELRVERFLDECEAETDLVLLVADPTPTAWSRSAHRPRNSCPGPSGSSTGSSTTPRPSAASSRASASRGRSPRVSRGET